MVKGCIRCQGLGGLEHFRNTRLRFCESSFVLSSLRIFGGQVPGVSVGLVTFVLQFKSKDAGACLALHVTVC